MTIIENNVKISKFMGLAHIIMLYHTSILDSNIILDPHELKYHKDWNWLMPVVKKCFSSKDNDKMSELTGYFDFWNLDEMYGAVITYINWHNSQNT